MTIVGASQAGAGSTSDRLQTLSDIAWRVLLIGAAVVGAGFVVDRLRLVLVPVVVAALLVTVLVPPVQYLERKGLPPLGATWAVVLLFLAGVAGALVLAVRPIAAQADEMGPAISDGIDDVEAWLVDGPLGLDPERVADARASIGDHLGDLAGSGAVASAVAVGEIVAGAVLALALSFFAVKDARRLQELALAAVPSRHRHKARAAGDAAASALRGYLRGAAVIGAVEAIVLTTTLALVGAELAVAVGGLTFVAAFFPFIGAVAAGLVAVLVALVAGGAGDAAVVALVAVLVQQFDNELLAPVIYGRMTRLHPIAVLLAVTTGATLGGVAGAFVAVPVLAAGSAAVGAVRACDSRVEGPSRGGHRAVGDPDGDREDRVHDEAPDPPAPAGQGQPLPPPGPVRDRRPHHHPGGVASPADADPPLADPGARPSGLATPVTNGSGGSQVPSVP